jgi:hypothetical protein
MESPLSFDSTENFRKKLLLRNLKPYTVDGIFSAPKLENKTEIILVDYSVSDSPNIEKEQKSQEKKLIGQNKYNPNDGFGNIVSINLNKNSETNFGNYTINNTNNSKLQLIGDTNEKLLYVQNIYGPVDFSSSYGNTIDINKNLNTKTNFGLYGFSKTFGSYLETFGIQKEIELVVQNQYGADQNSPLKSVDPNINKQTKPNSGTYGYADTLQSSLQNNGFTLKNTLLGKNQYGPQYFQSTQTVNPNVNLQSKANEGNYGYDDSIGSELELNGNNKEKDLIVLNKYSPTNGQNGFGNSISFPLLSNGSGFGLYEDQSDANGSSLELFARNREDINYTRNKYGPQGLGTSYGLEVFINKYLQLSANVGEYDADSTSGDGSELEILGETKIKLNLIKNEYQPLNTPTIVNPNADAQQEANKGEYNYTASRPPLTTEQSQSFVYQKNKYNSGDGAYDALDIVELFPGTKNSPYWNSSQSFIFQPSFYTPINILLSDNPSGSEGSLSQDSDLAKIAAKQLQKEYKARIALELIQQTLGQSTLSNNSSTNISGEISQKPSFDPFDALGVVTNKLPILQKDYRITSPGNLVSDALSFTARLSGLYSPYSIIPGEVFDYPQRNFLSQLRTNPVGATANVVGGLINQITSMAIDSSSELLLNNTGAPTKAILYDQLFYNQYRPKYRLDSLQSPNLSAPKENFYVGKNKNFIRDAVSPRNEVADGKFGNINFGPVFDYGVIGQEYEGNEVQKRLFGLKSYPYYDARGGVQGGFTWVPKSKSVNKPGQPVGPNNKVYDSTESVVDPTLQKQINDTDSSVLNFTDGSLLDITQKLVEAASKSSKPLSHVGNAINQISKVFNDGYIEMTKGSRVRRYLTPNAVQGSTKVSDIVGYEYGRLFSKDIPFTTYKQLQKTRGNIRKSTYSILDNTYNLNIAPMKGGSGVDSTNITRDGRVKKYMFSLENLAWRTSNRPGFTVDDLPACEKGPNGGRIMWFPPYDLSIDDSTRTTYNANTFLGRTEPIYTFQNSERSATLKFKIIVDHPSILNVIVNKELEKADASVATQVVESFMAGCLNYDIYELLSKYKQFSLSDVYDVISTLNPEQLSELTKEVPNATIIGETTINDNVNLSQTENGAEQQTTFTENFDKDKFQELQLLFDETNSGNYNTDYTTFIENGQNTVLTNATDKVYNYVSGVEFVNPPASLSLGEYLDTRKSSIQQVFSFATTEYNTFKDLLSSALKNLDGGATITISIEGSTYSASNGGELSRADSVSKMISDYSEGDLKMQNFIDNKKLTVEKKSIGTPTVNEGNFRDIDCSKTFTDNTIYQYSVQGMMCRAAKVSVTAYNPGSNTAPTQQTQIPSGPETSLPDPIAADVNNPNNTQPQSESSNEVKNSRKKDNGGNIGTGLTKKLLRKLLSECDYFEMIAEQNPLVYDGIKSRFKNFNPAFHSITPEGLNSRLTFLNQCMRPGDTIPTAVETGQGVTLQYNDVINSAFGSPPICVLRVGDFFHSKVIIESLDISFDDAKFDLNPEGIGVQPMIADVSLSIKFIGGSGLKEPVSTLQNALSFNYYANTEMYDERAEETDAFTNENDKLLVEEIKNEVGIIAGQQRPLVNDGGTTIGTIQTNTVDLQTNTITGTVTYKDVMDNMLSKTQAYMDCVNKVLIQLKDDLLWGGLITYTKDRLYSTGYFDYLGGSTSNEVNIFGKPQGYQQRIDNIFNKAKDDVENDLSPILEGINENGFSNSEIRKVKRKLTKMIDERKTPFIETVEKGTTDLIKNELSFIGVSDQINFILSNVDGYKNKQGGAVIYTISGTTAVDPQTTNASDTYIELQNDTLQIRTGLNALDSNLKNYQIITNGEKEYNDNLTFKILDNILPQENAFFIIFGKEILLENGYKTFVESLLSEVSDSQLLGVWVSFLYKNIGFNVGGNNQPTTQTNDGRYKKYENSKKTLDDNFSDFKTKYFDIALPNEQYLPFKKGKERMFDYTKQNTVTPPNDTNLFNLWSTVDSTDDKFNLKKKMN